MCANDDRWSAFLRGYLEHSRRRVAWNCLLVDELAPAGATWLDVGSFGVEPLWLLRRRPDLQVRAVSYEGMGLHLAADGIRQGAPADKGAPFVQVDRADIERDPLPLEDASCDVVTCFECIEHLRATPKPLLDEIRRVLKPDGRLLLTTPNLVGSRAMVRLLAGKNPQENPRYHRHAQYGIVHPKEYTMRELVQLLEARGLAVEHSSSRYFRPVGFVDRLAALVGLVTRPLGGLLLGIGAQPVHMGDNLFVVARRHQGPRDEWPPLLFEGAEASL